jgi:hypothetical protein
MEWFLFVDFDDNIVKFTFTNKYKRVYKEYTCSICDICNIELKEFETDLINIMNINVAMRDSTYIVCDIRSSIYDFIVKDMSRLLFRTKAILDLGSFYTLEDIFTGLARKIKN